ncbi:hypothetical protein DFR29_1039 [Tahibacter aquaticus]|uniref:DUF6881 domain-containing protein n=1 Tax=Tahibacter aquaticus TaxID=520092 RepID=A0A4R6Z477_9GAMM|nr:hypothetical protein [Tahibacter aquaticus]TDR46478.1 hypothetical protein DFR29_1039 [Tahibacter aquaticus]
MEYLDVAWKHDSADYSIRTVSEIDAQRYEIRKLDYFPDGRIGFATEHQHTPGTGLSDVPIPPPDINDPEEFVVAVISADVFERLWQFRMAADDEKTSLAVAELLRLAHAHRWDEASGFFETLCQHHCEWRPLDNLVAALRAPLEAVCPRDVVREIDTCLGGTRAFEAGLQAALELAIERAIHRSDIAALYCEYFFDGSEASSADVFLCQSFTRTDDDWASQFRQSDVISGPSIHALLNYDPERGLDPVANVIASVYAHAVLLRCFCRVMNVSRQTGLPIGFAQRDFPVTYL